MTKVRTRIGSVLLVAVLLLSLMPVMALATNPTEDYDASYTNSSGRTTYYKTVGAAISASNSGGGGTIELLKDAVLKASDAAPGDQVSNLPYGYGVAVREDLTLDLGGKVLTCGEFFGIAIYYVDFTIQNGTYKNTCAGGSAIEAGETSTVTVKKDAIIEADSDALVCDGRNTVYVYGEIYGGNNGVWGYGPSNNITLDGAHIESQNYAVYQNASDKTGSTYIIKNSTIIADDDSPGVYLNNNQDNHTLTIENSSISAGIGVYMSHTNATISGEKTKIVSTNTAGNSIYFGHNGEEDAPEGTSGSLTINGGEFEGPIGVKAPTGSAKNKAVITITGGTFSDDVSDYVQPGMKQENDAVVIDTKTAVAKIGDVGYATLSDALSAAKDGDTITLLKEITDQSLIELGTGTDVTIDLNGFDIGFAENSFFKVNGGKLHLTGSGKVYEQKPYDAPIKIWGSTTDVADYSVVTVDENVTLEGWAGIFITVNPDGGGVNHAFGVKVTVDGTIHSVEDTTGYNGHGVYINGMNQDMSGNVPQITLGPTSEITSTGDGIYAAGYAEWKLAGDITAPDALSIKSGTFEITGGTYHSTGEFADPAAANSNGSENTGAALSITSNKSYAQKTVVNVTGGTFISDNGYAVYEGIAKKEDAPAADSSYAAISISGGTFQGSTDKGDVKIAEASNKQVISGGTFSTDLSADEYQGYLAESVQYQVNHTDETFSYAKTLEDAQKLAKQGDTITDLKATETFTLTLDYNDDGMTTTVTYTVAKNTPVTLPTPTRNGYNFKGWSDGTTTYDAGYKYTVTADVDLTAQWSKKSGGTVTPTPTPTPEPEKLPFTDVTEGQWFYEAVQYVYDAKLMNGITDTTFEPDSTTTRGMIVTVLYRMAGEPAVTGESAFTDVAAGSWYEDAIIWAAANGIVEGYGDGTFFPDADVTREQMAAILYRYAEYAGLDVTGRGDLTAFPDGETVSAWAEENVAWAVAEGLLTGRDDQTLDPAGTATRAEIATILMRYCETVAK